MYPIIISVCFEIPTSSFSLHETYNRRNDCERSVRPTALNTPDNMTNVETVILENRRVTMNELMQNSSISYETVVRIIEDLGFLTVLGASTILMMTM